VSPPLAGTVPKKPARFFYKKTFSTTKTQRRKERKNLSMLGVGCSTFDVHKNAFVFSGLAGLGNMNRKPFKAVHYELIDHTADFGIRVLGTDAADLFRNGASALTDLITDARMVKSTHACHVRVSGDDWQDLMVNWLRELLYMWAGEEKLIEDVDVESIRENEIEAIVRFETYSPQRHVLKNEIKAVTYHQIQVFDSGNGWQAQIIFDA
jgi:SHS2 domain-containing protein